MVQKQITFCGEAVELDCRERTGLFYRLHPRSKQEIEDCLNPMYRKAARIRTREGFGTPEKTLNEFE